MDQRFRQVQRQAQIEGRDSRADLEYLTAQLKQGVITHNTLYAASDAGDRNAQILLRRREEVSNLANPLFWDRFSEILRDEYTFSSMFDPQVLIKWALESIKYALQEVLNFKIGRRSTFKLFENTPSEHRQFKLIIDIIERIYSIPFSDDPIQSEAAMQVINTQEQELLFRANSLCPTNLPDNTPVFISQSLRERERQRMRRDLNFELKNAVCNLAQAAICEGTGCSQDQERFLSFEEEDSTQEEFFLTEVFLSLDQLWRIMATITMGQRKRRLSYISSNMIRRRAKISQILADILLNRSWNLIRLDLA